MKRTDEPIQMNDNTYIDAHELGQLIIDINEIAGSVIFADFQNAVLKRLSESLSFDRAWWGLFSGQSTQFTKVKVHTDIVYALPSDYREDWIAHQEHDIIAQFVQTNPNITGMFNEEDIKHSKPLHRVLRGYDIRHVLCTQSYNPQTQTSAFISLYRGDEPFSDGERAFKELAMPHLVSALRSAWKRQLENAIIDSDLKISKLATAICDDGGTILVADDQLANVIRQEWPYWTGPTIPIDISQQARIAKTFRGRRLKIDVTRISNLFFVRVRERNLISELSKRELEVAEAYSSGQTYKHIAREIELSPTTVRHYIRNVFLKLGVNNKAELTRTMFEGGYPFIHDASGN